MASALDILPPVPRELMMTRIPFWPVTLLLGVVVGCSDSSGPGIAPPPDRATPGAGSADTAKPNVAGPKLKAANLPGLSVTPPAK